MENVYPFLVSRNEYLDYQTIVAPDFLVNERMYTLLAEVAGGSLTEHGNALHKEIHGSRVGNLTLVFRVIRAERSIIFPNEEGILRDEGSRPINLIEGIVLRDFKNSLKVTSNVIQNAHDSVLESYRDFWKARKWTARSSESFSANDDGAALFLIKEAPFVISTVRTFTQKWQHIKDFVFKKKIKSLGISYDNEILTILYSNRDVDIYDLDLELDARILSSKKKELFNASSFAYHSREKTIVFGLSDSVEKNTGDLILWNIDAWDSKIFSDNRYTSTGEVNCVAFGDSNNLIISGSKDQKIKQWDVQSKKTIKSWDFELNISSIAFHPTEKLFAVGGEDNTVKIYNIETKDFIQLPINKDFENINSLVFSSDGKMLAAASSDYSIKLINVSSWELITELKGHKDEVTSIAFHCNNSLLASGSSDSIIKIWNLKTKGEELSESKHKGRINSVAFSPNGKILMSGGNDCIVNIWKLT